MWPQKYKIQRHSLRVWKNIGIFVDSLLTQFKESVTMGLFMFKTPKPKKFQYIPRFYNPEKEALEHRKAALGLESELSDHEKLRLKLNSTWRKKNSDSFENPYRRMSMIVYAVVIVTGLYFIFFTDMIDTFLRAFGVGK
ncbi:MAG: hypothetical protein FD155_1457 [Bacteroidetes bacterium]|nr:MAG: hypothetical protein FD155_1457 [Bacteroidota bacterium]